MTGTTTTTTQPQWPPRSPHEALLSTPSGRRRLAAAAAAARRREASVSPSPFSSPTKRGNARSTATAAAVAPDVDDYDGGGDDAALDDDEEDEETLQLKLQEIQARLRLKQLRQQRGKRRAAAGGSDVENEPAAAQTRRPAVGDRTTATTTTATAAAAAAAAAAARSESAPLQGRSLLSRAAGVAGSRPQSSVEAGRAAAATSSRLGVNRAAVQQQQQQQQQQQASVQVPASPVRRTQAAQEHTQPHLQVSPRRVQLGIDKGRTGQDISLKRAPGLVRKGGVVVPSPAAVVFNTANSRQPRPPPPPPAKSFSERLAEARTDEDARAERIQRVRQVRSSAFDLGRKEMEHYKSNAVEVTPEGGAGGGGKAGGEGTALSRVEVLAVASGAVGGRGGGGGGYLKRSNTVPSVRSAPMDNANATNGGGRASALSGHLLSRGSQRGDDASSDDTTAAAAGVAFDPYSATHLTKRILPHAVLARTLAGKRVMTLPDLLRDVKAPDFQLPDVEQDVVVLAIVASKSEPRDHAPKAKANRDDDGGGKTTASASGRPSKYMCVTLTDLKWDVDLYLFDAGFERFWKLTEGTLVALLNPGVLPPRPGQAATGRFSLVVNTDGDALLEVGVARDLAFCRSVKADGSACRAHVDRRRTEFCEFHTNEALARRRASRMEVATMDFGWGRGGGEDKGKGSGGRGGRWQQQRGGGHVSAAARRDAEDAKAGRGTYDRESHSRVFTSRALGAAQLIDGEGVAPGNLADRLERREGVRKRVVALEKERDIARRLGEVGGGAGKLYLGKVGEGAALPSAGSQQGKRSGTAARGGDAAAADAALSLSRQLHHAQQLEPRVVDARSLGLLLPSAKDDPSSSSSQPAAISLSPINKRKRRIQTQQQQQGRGGLGSSQSSASEPAGGSNNAREAVGWGSNLSSRLAKMKADVSRAMETGSEEAAGAEEDRPALSNNPDRATGAAGTSQAQQTTTTTADAQRRDDGPPVRKKTRFVTAKGIREAGRESLGDELVELAKTKAQQQQRKGTQVVFDDGDELEIV